MNIKLIACGSTKWDRLIRNWGISFLINEDVLFDTFGKPQTLLNNIKEKNIDISKIKHIIISHEHWDHTSGLWDILTLNNMAIVYVCSHTDNTIKERIKSYGVTLKEIDSACKITENIYTTGELSKDGNLYEQCVYIKTEKGIVLVTGCAHPGIIKIIKKTKQESGDNIYAVIGGLHLKDSTIKDIENVVSELKKMNINFFVPLHCTGKIAVDLFKSNLNCISLEEI